MPSILSRRPPRAWHSLQRTASPLGATMWVIGHIAAVSMKSGAPMAGTSDLVECDMADAVRRRRADIEDHLVRRDLVHVDGAQARRIGRELLRDDHVIRQMDRAAGGVGAFDVEGERDEDAMRLLRHETGAAALIGRSVHSVAEALAASAEYGYALCGLGYARLLDGAAEGADEIILHLPEVVFGLRVGVAEGAGGVGGSRIARRVFRLR